MVQNGAGSLGMLATLFLSAGPRFFAEKDNCDNLVLVRDLLIDRKGGQPRATLTSVRDTLPFPQSFTVCNAVLVSIRNGRCATLRICSSSDLHWQNGRQTFSLNRFIFGITRKHTSQCVSCAAKRIAQIGKCAESSHRRSGT